MFHIHTGPDVKKKTEEQGVECGDNILSACQPVKALGFDNSANQTGIMLLTSFF